jgi:hypothetical protein
LPLDFSPANLSESYTISEREIYKLERILHSFKSFIPSKVPVGSIEPTEKNWQDEQQKTGWGLGYREGGYRERERERERESHQKLCEHCAKTSMRTWSYEPYSSASFRLP